MIKNHLVHNYKKEKNIIFSNCKYCLYSDTCSKYESCEYLTPIDEDDYCNNLMDDLQNANLPSSRKFLSSGKRDLKTFDDGIETQYHYYRQMINECLRDIRAGRIAYVYTERHVAEILRFEPDINVVHQDGVFYITK